VSNGNTLMEEWEEFQRFEKFQASRPKPEAKPEPVNPHLAYTQGPSGQTVCDWKAFSRGYTSDQLVPRSTAPDRRFNDDPVEFYAQVCVEEGRAGLSSLIIESVNGKITAIEEA
jgi:hypothetical protein